MKPTIIPLSIWLGIFLALVVLFHPRGVLADALAEAKNDSARVALYKEPCALKEEITNLPFRATWEEGGKVFEGCWLPHQNVGFVIAYFSDKTVALISMSLLVKLRSS